MTVKTFLWGAGAVLLLSLGVLALSITLIDPTSTARGLGFLLFFLSLFLAVASFFSIAGYAFRSIFIRKQLSAYRVRPALRQGVFLGAFVDLLLFLQLQRILVWWVSAILVILFLVIEVVFISYDRNATDARRSGTEGA